MDCNACVPECPIDAIYDEDDLPEDQLHFVDLNADLSKVWPEISEAKPALVDHEQWDGAVDKVLLLER